MLGLVIFAGWPRLRADGCVKRTVYMDSFVTPVALLPKTPAEIRTSRENQIYLFAVNIEPLWTPDVLLCFDETEDVEVEPALVLPFGCAFS